ncbi:CMGC protein kinase [Aspergillus keveii]|uniref:CMGC protein kinase n=1 Tax=Aspergillus keveii TaxID=714993 RepID=A0ABR4GN89_9EURO
MATLLKWARNAFKRAPLTPLKFSNTNFKTSSASEILEEERFEFSKYQVIGKLGFDVTSTVWLARDLEGHQYVTLKVYTRDEDYQEDGSWHVRTALDTFTIPRSGGDNYFSELKYRNPIHHFTEDLLKAGLMQVLVRLDYLHTECKLVHTGIKGDNILQVIADKAILESFSKTELEYPSPRKFVDGAPVYASRQFDVPKSFGRAVLIDFGSAVRGDEQQNHNAQPNFYRSPEVMLKADWSYPIDIWSVGVMIWDLFEDRHLFYGNDPDGRGYTTRAHLAEMIGILGTHPMDLISQGARSHEFFTEDKKDKEMFMDFMRGMLQWRPEDRKTAKELLQDPWLNDKI